MTVDCSMGKELGLHAKVLIVDRNRVFIGGANGPVRIPAPGGLALLAAAH